MAKVHVNVGYELYQIITDFGDPLEIFREGIQNSFDEDASEIYIDVHEEEELGGDNRLIIDIWDNGNGLAKCNVKYFFDVANSSKINKKYIPIENKHGYKGHGSKVFFNAELVQICSKTREGDYWASELKDAIKQIAQNKELSYADPCKPEELGLSLPAEWVSGFMVRIICPKYFKSPNTHFKLNHLFLRDYCKWYSLIGTVETEYNEALKQKNIKLFLRGLLSREFEKKYNDLSMCDPIPVFTDRFLGHFEEISLGHYFPPTRTSDKEMKKYANLIQSNKANYMFYSKRVLTETITSGSISFRLIISMEGYETKRRYDLLLSRQGKAITEGMHTDGQRYGLWACKGGVPIEKIDDWLEGGRGVGSYTYMQAFVDCDAFQLTANRGSIMNTDIEKLEIIKKEVNRVFKSKKIKDAMQERQDWEELEKTITSIEADKKDLSKRFTSSKNRKTIKLPNDVEIFEPTKFKNGYSESETFVVLMAIIQHYPDLFSFKLLDYNTTKGIDFVVEDYLGYPKYIELKGTLTKKINHPFRLIHKFICYDIDVSKNEIVEDMEPFKTTLKVIRNNVFESNDDRFDKKEYTGYVLEPEGTTIIQSMEVICLKSFLVEVLDAKIQ